VSDKFTIFMNHEISNLNTHLPIKTLNLEQILKLSEPGYYTRTKEFVTIDAEELEFIKKSLPVSVYKTVEMPIYLTRRRDMGSGTYVIGGPMANIYLIRKCLNDKIENFDSWRLNSQNHEDRFVYNYNMSTIRKKLPTTTIQAFA
jgi:uncharacterized protein (UPF0216 family)